MHFSFPNTHRPHPKAMWPKSKYAKVKWRTHRTTANMSVSVMMVKTWLYSQCNYEISMFNGRGAAVVSAAAASIYPPRVSHIGQYFSCCIVGFITAIPQTKTFAICYRPTVSFLFFGSFAGLSFPNSIDWHQHQYSEYRNIYYGRWFHINDWEDEDVFWLSVVGCLGAKSSTQ